LGDIQHKTLIISPSLLGVFSQSLCRKFGNVFPKKIKTMLERINSKIFQKHLVKSQNININFSENKQ
jgi:hypothetical protein